MNGNCAITSCGEKRSISEIKPAFMTLREVAIRLAVGEKTVRRLIDRGILPRNRHLGKILIPVKAVERLVEDSN